MKLKQQKIELIRCNNQSPNLQTNHESVTNPIDLNRELNNNKNKHNVMNKIYEPNRRVINSARVRSGKLERERERERENLPCDLTRRRVIRRRGKGRGRGRGRGRKGKREIGRWRTWVMAGERWIWDGPDSSFPKRVAQAQRLSVCFDLLFIFL